jgi:glycosyltransferase involved in cell wall biosynthesis
MSSSPIPPAVLATTSLNPLVGQVSHALNLAFGKRPPRRADPVPSEDADSVPIIAFCHLSWHWVWQRPQQFLSRLARRRPLLFVEAYCTETSSSYATLHGAEGHPSVTILQMHLPKHRWHDGAFIDQERRRLLKKTLAEDLQGRFERAVLWFNDPMAAPAFIGQLGERAIVYDCMDELTQFKGASPALVERERDLLVQADVVFCGGRKMRDKRLPSNRNCHFYGTGVDCAHFGLARSPNLAVSPDIAALDGPVLGYFGVVDERLDYALLDRLAAASDDWHVVVVGPPAKVDPAKFPHRHNLHWLGARPYEELPGITKGYSVCLMPFALNAATEYINPTKALEYMAAGKPVVSTALDEVKTNYRGAAHVADSHDEFITLCRRQVKKPSRAHIARGLEMAQQNTWESIVAKMEGHIADALAGAPRPAEQPDVYPSVPSEGTAAYV